MKRSKTCCAFIALLLTIVTLYNGVAFAAPAKIAQSSTTLSAYNVMLKQGNSSGKLKVTYDVTAKNYASSLGVSSIIIYQADGTYVTTITGTVSNGLIKSNSIRHQSSYNYSCTAGEAYYAVVTIFATINGVSDSRDITTDTVIAP